ncbi:MAG: hypothetical protein NC218_05685 [Acetobacter sp.]|nr:hypothetical protein [Acetobacter sp.]
MRFLLTLWTAFILLCPLANAKPATLQSLYTNPEGKHLSEAIIFYSSANTCQNCHKAIDMMIAVLKENYQGKLHAYLIDTARHPEFISAFHLTGPLNLVIIRISDGAAFGYRKLSGLQSRTGNSKAFTRRITEFINNFLDF